MATRSVVQGMLLSASITTGAVTFFGVAVSQDSGIDTDLHRAAEVGDWRTFSKHVASITSVPSIGRLLVLVAGSGSTRTWENEEERKAGQYVRIAQYLLDAWPDMRADDLNDALMAAATFSTADMVETLLQAGADPNFERAALGRWTNTVLCSAVSNLWTDISERKRVVRALIASGAHIETRCGQFLYTPLMAACNPVPWRNGRMEPGPAENVETIEELLRAGADPNAIALNGKTALHVCARRQGPKTCETLRLAGADPKTRDDGGRLPIDEVVTSPGVDHCLASGTDWIQRNRENRDLAFCDTLHAALADRGSGFQRNRGGLLQTYDDGRRRWAALVLSGMQICTITEGTTGSRYACETTRSLFDDMEPVHKYRDFVRRVEACVGQGWQWAEWQFSDNAVVGRNARTGATIRTDMNPPASPRVAGYMDLVIR